MTRIIIRAVPERSTDVEYLVKHIPHAEICWETYELENSDDNIWNTFDKALEMAGDEPCVQMEEDVILTEGFVDKLEEAVSAHPDQIINFFSMRDLDLTKGSRVDRQFMMAQCWYAPKFCCSYLREFYPFWKHKRIQWPNAVDLMVHDFIHALKLRYRIHCPSLVQHRDRTSFIDETRGERWGSRQSKTFINPIEE